MIHITSNVIYNGENVIKFHIISVSLCMELYIIYFFIHILTKVYCIYILHTKYILHCTYSFRNNNQTTSGYPPRNF